MSNHELLASSIAILLTALSTAAGMPPLREAPPSAAQHEDYALVAAPEYFGRYAEEYAGSMEAPRIPAGTAPFVSSGLSRRQLDSLFGGGFGHGRRAASARRAGPRDGGRMRFGQTDRDSALERFAKRNIDEIDRTAFDSFFKRNLDEIDRVGWNGFGKRSDDYSPDRERF